MRSEPIIAVGGVCLGPLEASENALGPIRAFGPPAADIFQPMPYSAAQSMADFLMAERNLQLLEIELSERIQR